MAFGNLFQIIFTVFSHLPQRYKCPETINRTANNSIPKGREQPWFINKY